MKFNCILLLAITFLVGSCSAWKDNLKPTGDQNDAVQNVIVDFLATSNLSKKDSVFSIYVENLDNGILGISIGGDYNKIRPNPDDEIGNKTSLPSRYAEKEGKLFYWDDSTQVLTKEVVNVLSKYNIMDSVNTDGVVELPRFDSANHYKKGVHYYMCENDLTKYKKVTTSKAMGYYEAPSLNCNP